MTFCLSTHPNISKKGRRKNYLSNQHVKKIIDTYRERPEYVVQYARRVKREEIEVNDFELNITSYVNTDELDFAIDLSATHSDLVKINKQTWEVTVKHNEFLKELGLSSLPTTD